MPTVHGQPFFQPNVSTGLSKSADLDFRLPVSATPGGRPAEESGKVRALAFKLSKFQSGWAMGDVHLFSLSRASIHFPNCFKPIMRAAQKVTGPACFFFRNYRSGWGFHTAPSRMPRAVWQEGCSHERPETGEGSARFGAAPWFCLLLVKSGIIFFVRFPFIPQPTGLNFNRAPTLDKSLSPPHTGGPAAALYQPVDPSVPPADASRAM